MTRLGQIRNKLSDVSGVRIAEALESNSTVTLLSLVSCDVGVRGIHNCAHVTRLEQDFNKLSDISGVRIAEALKTNSTVTQLSLVSCDAVVRGIVHT